MAVNYMVIGQSAPSATTATTLYTVPSATQTVLSTITVCNRSATAATYRIAVRPAGAALANEHYLAYDAPLSGNDTIALTWGLTMEATDVLTVYASTADTTFIAFGSEIA